MYECQDAIRNFVTEMLHDSVAAQRILALWMVRSIPLTVSIYVALRLHEQEYEEQTTPEARFVKGQQDLIMDNGP